MRDFNQVIDDESIKDSDSPTSHYFDPYLNMKLGMPRDPDDSLTNTYVKRHDVDINNEQLVLRTINRYYTLTNVR